MTDFKDVKSVGTADQVFKGDVWKVVNAVGLQLWSVYLGVNFY